MNLLARQDLEGRIFNAVQLLLTVSDLSYLQTLSRFAFFDALENELRFLGFYADSDEETPTIIHAFLERHVDQWQLDIGQMQEAIFTESQPLQERHIQMPTSPLICGIENSSPILSLMKTTHFFGFMPLQYTNIQIGSNAS
jgi:hypothetical protein